MLNEGFNILEFFVGLIFTIFFAQMVNKLMVYIIRQYESFPAPKGIDQIRWENAFSTPEGVQPVNRIIGFLEVVFYFMAFYIGKAELIAGWLAFKVASKWQAWATILKVPEKIGVDDQIL